MDVKYIRTTASKLNSVPVVDGQLIYLSDTNKQYQDVGTSRQLLGGGTSDKVSHPLKFSDNATLSSAWSASFDGSIEQYLKLLSRSYDAYTVAFPASGWIAAEDSWQGISTHWKNSVKVTSTTAPAITANTEFSIIQFASGDRDSAGTWDYLKTVAGAIELYSAEKPAKDFTCTFKVLNNLR